MNTNDLCIPLEYGFFDDGWIFSTFFEKKPMITQGPDKKEKK